MDFILIAALVACVQAGGPAAYSISALSGDYGSVGSTQENTVKGLYGQNVLSQYSKAVDSPHSSVRVSSSRQTNDNLAYGPHYGAALAAPAYGHAGYYGQALGHAAYAPALAHHSSYASPLVSSHGAYAPAIAAHHGAYAPAITAHHGAYAAAPAISYAHQAAPLAAYHGAPAAYGYGHPGLAHGYAASPLAYNRAPVAAIAGGPVYHSSFVGHGASYGW